MFSFSGEQFFMFCVRFFRLIALAKIPGCKVEHLALAIQLLQSFAQLLVTGVSLLDEFFFVAGVDE